jgi:hypothetical protein
MKIANDKVIAIKDRDNNITCLLGLSIWTNTLNNVMIIIHVYWVCQFGQTL